MNSEKREELLALMNIPEVAEIMLAKMEQVKLIFKDEIRDVYKQKRENIIDFPGKSSPKPRVIHRYYGEHAVLIDTTEFSQLPDPERQEIFNEYFAKNPQVREILMNMFFTSVLPMTEPDVIER